VGDFFPPSFIFCEKPEQMVETNFMVEGFDIAMFYFVLLLACSLRLSPSGEAARLCYSHSVALTAIQGRK
jgi:hypothetical protein